MPPIRSCTELPSAGYHCRLPRNDVRTSPIQGRTVVRLTSCRSRKRASRVAAAVPGQVTWPESAETLPAGDRLGVAPVARGRRGRPETAEVPAASAMDAVTRPRCGRRRSLPIWAPRRGSGCRPLPIEELSRRRARTLRVGSRKGVDGATRRRLPSKRRGPCEAAHAKVCAK